MIEYFRQIKTMGKECIFNHIGEKRGVVDQIRILDISVPEQLGTWTFRY